MLAVGILLGIMLFGALANSAAEENIPIVTATLQEKYGAKPQNDSLRKQGGSSLLPDNTVPGILLITNENDVRDCTLSLGSTPSDLVAVCAGTELPRQGNVPKPDNH